MMIELMLAELQKEVGGAEHGWHTHSSYEARSLFTMQVSLNI